MICGRNGFKKDRSGSAYHTEMDITGGACGNEAGDWNGKTVSVASCSGYEDCIDDDRCFVRQTMKGQNKVAS